eukprot:evm.model.scf_231.1 EVM.evm.TU.scf_231.1   scf_231:3363-4325(+)
MPSSACGPAPSNSHAEFGRQHGSSRSAMTVSRSFAKGPSAGEHDSCALAASTECLLQRPGWRSGGVSCGPAIPCSPAPLASPLCHSAVSAQASTTGAPHNKGTGADRGKVQMCSFQASEGDVEVHDVRKPDQGKTCRHRATLNRMSKEREAECVASGCVRMLAAQSVHGDSPRGGLARLQPRPPWTNTAQGQIRSQRGTGQPPWSNAGCSDGSPGSGRNQRVTRGIQGERVTHQSSYQQEGSSRTRRERNSRLGRENGIARSSLSETGGLSGQQSYVLGVTGVHPRVRGGQLVASASAQDSSDHSRIVRPLQFARRSARL